MPTSAMTSPRVSASIGPSPLRSKRRTARTVQASEKPMIDKQHREADDPDLGERAEIAVVGDARVVDHPVGPVGGAGLDDVVDRAGREVADPDAV